MNSYLSPRALVGAAIVGLVGAAGVFLYEQLYAEKRRAMLVREVARLDKQVSSMRTELESLKELQKEVQLRRIKSKKRVRRQAPETILNTAKSIIDVDVPDGVEQNYASDSEYFTDYQSVLGTDGDMDSEEFYDVHTDDEDDTLRETLENGHALGNDLEDSADKPDSPTRSPTKANT